MYGWLLALVLTAAPLIAQPKWRPDLSITRDGSDQVKAVTVSPKDHSVWVLTANLKVTPEVDELHRIDPEGQGQRVINISSGGPLERFESAIAATDEGDVFVVGWTKGRVHLVKIGASGEMAWDRPLGLDSLHALGLTAVPGGGVLLFGDGYRGAFAARIDASGRKLWTIDADKQPLAALFSSGVALDDGSAVLVGNVWDFKQGNIGMGLGTTLLVKADAAGEIVEQKTFPGRIATATRLRDGNIAVVDDPQSYAGAVGVGASAFQDNAAYAKTFMRLQSWTPDLALSWSARLPEFHVQFLPVSIAPAPHGGVVVLGNGRGFQFIASEYDAQGRLLWTTADSTRTWGVFSLAGSSGLFAVAHPVYDPDIRVALSQFTLK
jgi:hypothetical protein